jgi:hypothetical protein
VDPEHATVIVFFHLTAWLNCDRKAGAKYSPASSAIFHSDKLFSNTR